MFRPVAVAVVVSGLLAWPSSVGAEPISIGARRVPIVAVDLNAQGTPIAQNAPATTLLDQGHELVEVMTVTVDDAGPRILHPIAVSVTVRNVQTPNDVIGVAASDNGVQTPVSVEAFSAAAEAVFASADLRDYIRSDDLSRPGTEWGADYDVMFSPPLTADHYLLIHERYGNAAVELQALDESGKPLPRSPSAHLAPGDGWNTGIAPADQADPQVVHLSVLDIDALLAGTGATAVYGFRVDNNDEADINLTPMIELRSPLAPTIPAAGAQQATPALPVVGQGLDFTKTVYAGADGGAGCGSAGSFTEALQNDTVTYCFTVTNIGAAHLEGIAVSDPLVSSSIAILSIDSIPLAPGHSARYYVETTPPPDDADGLIDDTFINVASVTAVALDSYLQPVPDITPLTASAQAIVYPPEVQPNPKLDLATSVYAWHDGGQGCPAADLTLVDDGDPVTYCYTVTNTGNTHLSSIAFDQLDIGVAPTLLRADSEPLAPGHSAYYFAEANAPTLPPQGVIVNASATANSVNADGADLTGVADVTDQDGTKIQTRVEPAAQPVVPAQAVEVIEAPQQLAFTGWETWILVVAGIGFIAGGWSLVQQSALRRRTVPVRRDDEPGG